MTVLRTTLMLVAASMIGCAGPIKSQKNAYSYLGRVVEKAEDTVTEPLTRATNDPTPSVLQARTGAAGVIAYELLPKTKKETYQRYKIALEQGESVTLRSYAKDISLNECVRVWIAGPGVSPVYWYAPDQAELERAAECAPNGERN